MSSGKRRDRLATRSARRDAPVGGCPLASGSERGRKAISTPTTLVGRVRDRYPNG